VTFVNIGTVSYWWSATETNATRALYRYIYSFGSDVYRDYLNKAVGYSVRLVKD
jgi:hypothetical protein